MIWKTEFRARTRVDVAPIYTNETKTIRKKRRIEYEEGAKKTKMKFS